MADFLGQVLAIYCQVGDPPTCPFKLCLFRLKIIGPWLSIFPLFFYSIWIRLMQVRGTHLAQSHGKKNLSR